MQPDLPSLMSFSIHHARVAAVPGDKMKIVTLEVYFRFSFSIQTCTSGAVGGAGGNMSHGILPLGAKPHLVSYLVLALLKLGKGQAVGSSFEKEDVYITFNVGDGAVSFRCRDLVCLIRCYCLSANAEVVEVECNELLEAESDLVRNAQATCVRRGKDHVHSNDSWTSEAGGELCCSDAFEIVSPDLGAYIAMMLSHSPDKDGENEAPDDEDYEQVAYWPVKLISEKEYLDLSNEGGVAGHRVDLIESYSESKGNMTMASYCVHKAVACDSEEPCLPVNWLRVDICNEGGVAGCCAHLLGSFFNPTGFMTMALPSIRKAWESSEAFDAEERDAMSCAHVNWLRVDNNDISSESGVAGCCAHFLGSLFNPTGFMTMALPSIGKAWESAAFDEEEQEPMPCAHVNWLTEDAHVNNIIDICTSENGVAPDSAHVLNDVVEYITTVSHADNECGEAGEGSKQDERGSEGEDEGVDEDESVDKNEDPHEDEGADAREDNEGAQEDDEDPQEDDDSAHEEEEDDDDDNGPQEDDDDDNGPQEDDNSAHEEEEEDDDDNGPQEDDNSAHEEEEDDDDDNGPQEDDNSAQEDGDEGAQVDGDEGAQEEYGDEGAQEEYGDEGAQEEDDDMDDEGDGDDEGEGNADDEVVEREVIDLGNDEHPILVGRMSESRSEFEYFMFVVCPLLPPED